MTDFEDRVRAMLLERADDITAAPAVALEEVTPSRSHLRRYLPAAAAAVVLAVVALVVTLRGGGDDATPAAGTACTTELPAVWRDAITRLATSSDDGRPVAVAPDGTVFVATGGEVATATATGTRTVFRLPRDGETIDGVFADDHYVLVTLTWLPDGSTVVPDPALTDPFTRDVYLIDRSSGSSRRVTGMTDGDIVEGHDVVDDAVLYGGRVVYDVRPDASSRTGRLLSYDPATGDTQAVVHAEMSAPRLSGNGVTWDYGEYGSDGVPRSPYIVPHTQDIHTDGVGWAWAEDDGIHWATLHDDERTLRMPGLASPKILTVAGPYVVFWDESHDRQERVWVLDARTGAVASLGIQHGGDAFSAGGVIATYASGVGAIRLDTSTLPDLYC